MDGRKLRELDGSSIGAGFFQALDAQYASQIASALSTIDVYFANAVGIGEHPQHLEELDKLLEAIATAQDKRDALHRYFRLSSL